MSLPDRGMCTHEIIYSICTNANVREGRTSEELRSLGSNTYNPDNYLPQMIQFGLLEEKEGRFYTTLRGRSFVEVLEHANGFLQKRKIVK